MTSNKDNQLVEKNDDNLGVENISNDHSIESENKSVVSNDESSHKEEEIDNGFACFGFNKLILNSLESKGSVSYTHLRAHETRHDLVCRLLLDENSHLQELLICFFLIQLLNH